MRAGAGKVLRLTRAERMRQWSGLAIWGPHQRCHTEAGQAGAKVHAACVQAHLGPVATARGPEHAAQPTLVKWKAGHSGDERGAPPPLCVMSAGAETTNRARRLCASWLSCACCPPPFDPCRERVAQGGARRARLLTTTAFLTLGILPARSVGTLCACACVRVINSLNCRRG